MNLYFNTTLGSCLIIIIIAVDYLKKYNIDRFQRKLFIIQLSAIISAAILDFTGHFLEYKDSAHTQVITLLVWSAYLIMRNCCYYYTAVFIDYFSHGNKERTKKYFFIVTAFLMLYSVSAVVNIPLGYYFYISKENTYIPGTLYLFNLIISYFPIILIFIDINLTSKKLNKSQIYIIIVFIFITSIGAGIDIVLRTTNLIWPCFTAATLYFYFFIIKSDSKIDSLTGIGNRNSFNEYIESLSKQTDKKEYAIILFNLEHLKEINNNLGQFKGDNALRDIASIIKSCIRNTDFTARFGSDEFVVITKADKNFNINDNALIIIDRINAAIKTQNMSNNRPYQLFIRYDFDIFTTGSKQSITNLIDNIEKRMNKKGEK